MENHAEGHEIAFESLHRKDCMNSRLVLEAANIASQVVQVDGSWQLLVARGDSAAAFSELEAYRLEMKGDAGPVRVKVATFGGAGLAVFFYAAVVISVYVLDDVSAYGWQWSALGNMQAGLVMAGQSWRTVTALTLHADTAHLGSNLLFGIGFGYLVGRILGGGVGWYIIVLAGALGNAMNAAIRNADHTSIGASTAVFAALGVMVAHALRPRSSVLESPMRRWSPLVAGVLLLALIGVGGERTDVLAHITGFIAGTMIGWIGCRIPDRWLGSTTLQSLAAGTTLLIVFGAWSVAIAFSK